MSKKVNDATLGCPIGIVIKKALYQVLQMRVDSPTAQLENLAKVEKQAETILSYLMQQKLCSGVQKIGVKDPSKHLWKNKKAATVLDLYGTLFSIFEMIFLKQFSKKVFFTRHQKISHHPKKYIKTHQ